MKYIKFKRKNLGWIDPDTGKKLDSIDGRHNRPGIDAFEHLGYDYPDIINDRKKCPRWHGEGDEILLELDITDEEANQIILDNKSKSPELLPADDKKVKDKFKNK